jgi:hypothetical protein
MHLFSIINQKYRPQARLDVAATLDDLLLKQFLNHVRLPNLVGEDIKMQFVLNLIYLRNAIIGSCKLY